LQEERFIGTAPWGAPVSCLHQSPRLGAGLLWRQPGPAGFQLMQRVSGSACGWGWAAAAPAAASSLQAVVNAGSSAMPQSTIKDSAMRHAESIVFKTI